MPPRPRGKLPSPMLGAGLFLLNACGGVQIGTDQMTTHFSLQQSEACRNAVQLAAAQQGVTEDVIRRVHYQRIVSKSRGAGNRIIGVEAWIYPMEGPGALVVELNEACKVRRIWTHGSPTF